MTELDSSFIGGYVRFAPIASEARHRTETPLRADIVAKVFSASQRETLIIQLGSSWPIKVWILGRCNTISATRTSSTPSDTASFRRIGFEISGKTERRTGKTQTEQMFSGLSPKDK
jgi:hypothetical protein